MTALGGRHLVLALSRVAYSLDRCLDLFRSSSGFRLHQAKLGRMGFISSVVASFIAGIFGALPVFWLRCSHAYPAAAQQGATNQQHRRNLRKFGNSSQNLNERVSSTAVAREAIATLCMRRWPNPSLSQAYRVMTRSSD